MDSECLNTFTMVVCILLIGLVLKLVICELCFQFVYLTVSTDVLMYLLETVFFHVHTVVGWAVCTEHEEASARHQPV